MERERRRREKKELARAMSVAICVRNSSGLLNLFSSRRRFQKRTSMRLGGEERRDGLKPTPTPGEEEAAGLKSAATSEARRFRTWVSTLNAEPLNVGRIPMFVTERWLRVSFSKRVR